MKNFFIGWCLGCFITLNTKILLSHNKRKAFLIKIVSTSSYAVKFSSLFRMLRQDECSRFSSGSERNLIGRRTESDWAANGIRSGGGHERWKDVEGYGAEARSDWLSVGGYGIGFPLRAAIARRWHQKRRNSLVGIAPICISAHAVCFRKQTES